MTFTKNLFTRNKEKGVALIIAIFTMVIISYLVVEISYESNVEYIVNANAVSRLKAYYAAKSGMEMSLMRIKLYNKLQSQMAGQQIPAQYKQMMDMIWSFPFMWPPTLPEDALAVDKDQLQSLVKEAKMDAQYQTTITDEGSKFDINDLGSPSKGLREMTKKLIVSIFENRMANDEKWSQANRDLKYEEVINNITDWIDDDTAAINGGDERSMYSKLGSDSLPPNRGFRTVDELRMVAGMTPEVFNMLKDRVTVYGMKAINPNYASREIIMALDSSITDEVVAKILERRNDKDLGGPYQDAKDFWDFANSSGARVSAETMEAIPISCDAVSNFRIKSVGSFSSVNREIEAVVYDTSATAKTVADKLVSEGGNTAGTTGATTGATNTSTTGSTGNNNQTKEPLPKGPPRIVYWFER